jgi:hypothetical protein
VREGGERGERQLLSLLKPKRLADRSFLCMMVADEIKREQLL